MTISTTPSEVSYATDGVTTSFPIPFVFGTADDLKVVLTDADGNVAEVTTGFTTTGGNGSTGTLVFASAPEDEQTLTIIDDPEIKQATDYVSNDAFPAESHEEALDYLTRLVKRLSQQNSRALRTRDGDPLSGDDLILPSVQNRASRLMAFDADGKPEPAAAVDVPIEALTRSLIGALLYPQTPAEIAAGVTPASFAGSSRPWTDAVLRYGLNGDGSTDNLTAFTNMFAVGGQALFIKRGDYLLSAPINVPSNTTVYLEPGTIIRDGGVLDNTALIRIESVSNVHIIGWGAKVTMNRDDYTEGEQRHGVMIRGDCENICIEGLESSNCGGDGFFIGQHSSQSVFPQWVTLLGCKADNNRRQGLSITSGRHIRIVDSWFTNTNGTAPQAGIDIEPDANHFVLQDIKLINVYTAGNAQQGIKMYLAPLDSDSEPIDIEVINHRDVGSAYGLTVHQAWQGCRGNIRIYNPIWERNISFGFAAVSCAPENVLIELFNPLVIDCNQSGSSSDLSGTAYAVYREAGVAQTGKIGGVHIYEPNVQVTLGNYPVTSFYVANLDEPGEVGDVWIIDPKNVEYTAVAPTLLGGSPVYITDRHRVMRGNFTGSLTVTASRYFSHYSNAGASGQVNWDLADWPETESERTFEVHAAQVVNIRANQDNAALRILPGSYTALSSNEVGAQITLKRGPGGFWVTNMVGVWNGT